MGFSQTDAAKALGIARSILTTCEIMQVGDPSTPRLPFQRAATVRCRFSDQLS
jgi:hypothetical protein